MQHRKCRSVAVTTLLAPILGVLQCREGRGQVCHWFPFLLQRIWSSRKERWRIPERLDDVLRAERVALPCALGGYDRDLGWTGKAGEVDDVHLVAALQTASRGPRGWMPLRLSLCLTRSIVEQARARLAGSGVAMDGLADRIESLIDADLEDLDALSAGLRADIGEQLRYVFEQFIGKLVSAPDGARPNVVVRVDVDGLDVSDAPFGLRAAMCTVTISMPQKKDQPAGVVSLASHLDQVRDWAARDARVAGLSEETVAAVGTAGLWHDVGKAHPDFQKFLTADPLANVIADYIELSDGSRLPLLAKPHDDARQRTLRSPFRHEALSLVAYRHLYQDALVEHLICSHHGWYRPVVPPSPRYHVQGYIHADSFEALNERYGPWGLAYLEAVLRLADWRVSAQPIDVVADADPGTALLGLLPDSWDEVLKPPSIAVVSGAKRHKLDGLVTHPLTGWYASVGMLAAAVDAGDTTATLQWTTPEAGPQVPVLTTQLPLEQVVAHAFDTSLWEQANALVARCLLDEKMVLRRKNQKLAPAKLLRDVFLPAEEDRATRVLLGLLGDAAAADGTGQVELSIVPFANNSSYPGVALAAVGRKNAAEGCLAALTDMNAGYSATACDGGLDRPRSAAPLVNGIGAPGDERMTRTAIAPLALYGMGRLGNTGAAPLGVWGTGGRLSLHLPLPTSPATLATLRSMTIGIRSPTRWRWDAISAQWIYAASKEHLSARKEVDIVWSGRAILRAASELNKNRSIHGHKP